MYLTNIMIPKEKCYIANPKDTIHSALDKLEHHGIDGLPVVADGKYIGMITRYSIFRHYFFKKENVSRDEFIESTKIEEILTLDLHSLNANHVVEESLLNLQDFPILAVVNDDKDFLGIVTRYDVMEQFKSAFGMKQKGIRIAITSVEAEGRIKRLSGGGQLWPHSSDPQARAETRSTSSSLVSSRDRPEPAEAVPSTSTDC